MIKARNKETGGLCTVGCMDDYFGRHEYGYIVNGGNALGESTFCERYMPEDETLAKGGGTGG